MPRKTISEVNVGVTAKVAKGPSTCRNWIPSSGIRALYHMIYMLNVLIIASVVIMHVDICKSCEYGD